MNFFFNLLLKDKISGREVLFFNERSWANCITGPSDIGSEKGTPISIISAPLLIISSIISSDNSKSGSPATVYVINAFDLFFCKFLKVELIILIK